MNVQVMSKVCTTALVLMILGFVALRFVNLQADFPSGVTSSGVLYTDEGWYTNAAATSVIRGHWHVEGDFNPIVTMPMGYLIQAIGFNVWGMSLATARMTVALFSVFVIVMTYCLARRYVERTTCLIVTLLLSTNLLLFAFSRLAILEMLMMGFVMSSILLATSSAIRNNGVVALLSSVMLVVAVLTKSTAIFALPVLLYVLALREKSLTKRMCLAGVAAFVFVSVFGAYNLCVSYLYPDDYFYFKDLNLNTRASVGLLSVVRNTAHGCLMSYCVDPIAYPISLILSLLLLWKSRDFRENVLVRICFLWIFLYLGLLGLIRYHPPRYYLPLVIPTVVLLSVAISSLRQHLRKRMAVAVQMVIVLVVTFVNGSQVLRYMSHPSFTFVHMARHVKQLIGNDSQKVQDVVLLGHFANSIGLETGIDSINTQLGAGDLEWRIKAFRPQFYITLGNEPEVVSLLGRYYRLEYLAQWDVFDNYYNGESVQLFKLHQKEPLGALPSRVPGLRRSRALAAR